jgi:hypothetical protein
VGQVFLQNMGAFVLLLSLVVRLLSAPAHPWWKSYRRWVQVAFFQHVAFWVTINQHLGVQ